jgi:hypothetical protein
MKRIQCCEIFENFIFRFFTSHLKMFKIHVHSKKIIPLFYIFIEIMHISRLLDQHKILAHHYINY